MSRARSFRRVFYRGLVADQREAARPPRVEVPCEIHRTDRFGDAWENAYHASQEAAAKLRSNSAGGK
jgi:hypothetical protein